MKITTALVVALVLLFGAGLAAAEEDIAKHPACKFCGMDREKFASSRMLLEYEDGTSAGMCSLRCASVEMALAIDKFPKATLVGDHDKRTLLDAEKAFWVLGGSKPGVMTKRAKWAFASKESAEKFVAENGGSVVGYEAAVKAAYEDLYDDTRTIRERREAKRKAAAEKK